MFIREINGNNGTKCNCCKIRLKDAKLKRIKLNLIYPTMIEKNLGYKLAPHLILYDICMNKLKILLNKLY